MRSISVSEAAERLIWSPERTFSVTHRPQGVRPPLVVRPTPGRQASRTSFSPQPMPEAPLHPQAQKMRTPSPNSMTPGASPLCENGILGTVAHREWDWRTRGRAREGGRSRRPWALAERRNPQRQACPRRPSAAKGPHQGTLPDRFAVRDPRTSETTTRKERSHADSRVS